jgi:DNA-3-methyladenine glycosylase I
MSSYCDFAIGNEIHGPYHDHVHGFPTDKEPELFERLLLEINQAGLSWDLMLRKRAGFRAAYSEYDTRWPLMERRTGLVCWMIRELFATP